jgi:hypothetical protein
LKRGINNNGNNKEPIAPEIVLLGLIFVNFLPLKIFPTTNPPVSEKTEINKKHIYTLFPYRDYRKRV